MLGLKYKLSFFMEIKKDKIKEFQKIYKDKLGEDITEEKAMELAGRLLDLIKIIHKQQLTL